MIFKNDRGAANTPIRYQTVQDWRIVRECVRVGKLLNHHGDATLENLRAGTFRQEQSIQLIYHHTGTQLQCPYDHEFARWLIRNIVMNSVSGGDHE